MANHIDWQAKHDSLYLELCACRSLLRDARQERDEHHRLYFEERSRRPSVQEAVITPPKRQRWRAWVAALQDWVGVGMTKGPG